MPVGQSRDLIRVVTIFTAADDAECRARSSGSSSLWTCKRETSP